MNNFPLRAGAAALAIAVASVANAGTAPYFTPLTQSSAVGTPNDINEVNSPWQAPAGITQVNLMSMDEVEADASQSIIRVPDANQAAFGRSLSTATMFDMIAYDPTGRYLFIPHETITGAGVSRYDTVTDTNEVLFAGDLDGTPPTSDWSADFGAFDPARFTPNGTIILGEEWSGEGRLIEVLDPLDPAPVDPSADVRGNWRVLTAIPKVGHEGIQFSLTDVNKTLYYIDENNSGSIYKTVFTTAGDYTAGQTFVLQVDGYTGAPSDNYNGPGSATRTGSATWVPMTDVNGSPLTTTNPFGAPFAGRAAADEAGGTPFGRPEDMEIAFLPNGNEIIYFTATSEQSVYSVEMTGASTAMVRAMVTPSTPTNLGFAPTTGTISSPDNLAQDALGNIYIIEDKPNGDDIGGDVWFVRDTNNDGVAESIDHFLSIQVDGAEATGMIFHPTDPTKFVIAVQHPDSTDLVATPGGFGDAVWEFDLSGVVPPICDRSRGDMVYVPESRRWVNSCSRTSDFNFVRMLEQAAN